MKTFLTKRNVYIGLFTILYLIVALVSLFHSFAFFGLANDNAMSIMLGIAFETGQAAVLLSILTSTKDRSRIMPWILMIILTIVQILGNVFSSYKYLMTHSVVDLKYFKDPIFIWTTIPDDVATVIITYIVGAILPIIALCMTAMVSNYISDTDSSLDTPVNEIEAAKHNQEKDIIKEENKDEDIKEENPVEDIKEENQKEEKPKEYIKEENIKEDIKEDIKEEKPKEDIKEENIKEDINEENPIDLENERQSRFINLKH